MVHIRLNNNKIAHASVLLAVLFSMSTHFWLNKLQIKIDICIMSETFRDCEGSGYKEKLYSWLEMCEKCENKDVIIVLIK